jgi:hypothetical protein
LYDRHFGSCSDHLSSAALVIGRQVEHHHERHSVVSGHVFEELLNGLQATCRSAYAYDWKIQVTGLDVLSLRTICARI